MPRKGFADLASGFVAAATVAPFVAACDKAIAEAAAGQATVMNSVKASLKEMVSNPIHFLRQPAFRYLWVMYGGTYSAANLATTAQEAGVLENPLVKTGSIFVVNASLSLWKDTAFAKLFSGKPPAPVPKPALGVWYARDFISMATIFTAPPIVSKQMQQATGADASLCTTITQFSLPLMVQPFVAPLHLYGYVLYNNPTASFAEQQAVMRREIIGAIQMRIARCVAPYSVGTNFNRELRTLFRSSTA